MGRYSHGRRPVISVADLARPADFGKPFESGNFMTDRGNGSGGIGRIIGWARGLRSRIVRIPLALFLIACGLLGFLPVVGFWMLPIGLALLAEDLPILRRPARRLMARVEARRLAVLHRLAVHRTEGAGWFDGLLGLITALLVVLVALRLGRRL